MDDNAFNCPQVLCERRLSSTHAFALGVACRQMLAAAADSDWSGTVLYTDQAARRMSGIRKGLSAMSPDGEGSRSDSNGDSGDGSDGGGNTSVSRASVSRDALCATAVSGAEAAVITFVLMSFKGCDLK